MTRNRKWFLILGVALLAIFAVVVRLIAIHMYDLQIDEITYAHFAQTIDAGELPRDFNGQAFFLHPPGYFAMLAVWRAIFWHGGSIFAQYTVLRELNIYLSGLSVLAMFGLGKVVTKSNKLGLLAAGLFSIDPFLIRQNTRGLMETATMLWLLVGLWMLMRNLQKPAVTKLAWLSTGFVFGLAMVTKDVAINFLILMFALMAWRKVGPAKKAFRYIIPTAIIPYGIWIAIVAGSGYIGPFISQKTLGIRRFLGVVQITGFNAANAPSKSGTIMQTIPHYASSYGIMGLGAAASIWLLFSKDIDRRRWGCVGTAATLLLAYLYVGGTFEEQYLYYMMVPSIISVIVGFIDLWHVVPANWHRLMRFLAIFGILGTVIFSIASYAINMAAAPANGWQTTITWVDNNVPADSTICTYGQGDFLLSGHGLNVCDYGTMAALKANKVQYIIVSEKLTDSNYEPLSPSLYAQVQKISTRVFRYTSADSGTFDVLKMNPWTTVAPDTVKTLENVATTPAPAITPSTATVPTTVATKGIAIAGTLPNTGISLSSSLRVFASSSIIGTALAYLLLYFRSRKTGQPMGEDFLPEYAGSLALRGVDQW